MGYDKQCGRIRVKASHDGLRMQDYGHGVQIQCPDGWNDSCAIKTHTISVEEARDLRHLLDRLIDAADRTKP